MRDISILKYLFFLHKTFQCSYHVLGDLMKINYKKLIISIVIPLLVGFISNLFVKDYYGLYETIEKPLFSPPNVLFPIVWTILFILMGVAFYLIWDTKASKTDAYISYYLQLFFNFVWPILFFRLELYLVALVWITMLWLLILDTILSFYKINKKASYLMLPYLVWTSFATYLNFMVYVLN